ncbi:MAG TPA: aminotransferase DegT, partial [Candidatus Bathyarchaeota archaeon]|nr:aminotransferase DegT [Candidatus Bathyarchaeota archaeon]
MSQHEVRVPLLRPILDDEMVEAAVQALQNERFVLGESVFKFEEEFARYIGVKYAISTNSGTDALHIALLALGVGSKDEVLTTPFSFIASANC